MLFFRGFRDGTSLMSLSLATASSIDLAPIHNAFMHSELQSGTASSVTFCRWLNKNEKITSERNKVLLKRMKLPQRTEYEPKSPEKINTNWNLSILIHFIQLKDWQRDGYNVTWIMCIVAKANIFSVMNRESKRRKENQIKPNRTGMSALPAVYNSKINDLDK